MATPASDDERIEQWLAGVLDANPGRSEVALAALRQPAGPIAATVARAAASAAALLLAIHQPNPACALLELLLARGPDDPTLLNNLAYAHLASGRGERAVDLWEQASVLAPEDTLIRANLRRARRWRTPGNVEIPSP
jgi:Flp pilus assembly protein TadD